MKENIKKWIWQHDDYPNFKYDKESLVPLLNSLEYNRGVLEGISKLSSKHDIKNMQLQALLNEAINTSEIEGEYLKRDSVRASLLKKLDSSFDILKDTSTHQTDKLVDILLDCALNKKPLTKDRLHGWHNCLFENRYSGLDKINVAKYREIDDMKVVSGAIGYEKVHYLAPPKDEVLKDMDNLLEWCGKNEENIYIKTSLAHLWFVSIHPYDDGNGRIARAITDYLLSSGLDTTTEFKLYSISSAINRDRKGYYDILDKTTNLFINREFDFTQWLKWHLNILNNAMLISYKQIEYIIQKTKFWDKYRDANLNTRQVKVLNKILDKGSENYEGGINTKKYINMTKVSKATAVRDISELQKLGCIKQVEGSSGRNVRYEVIVL